MSILRKHCYSLLVLFTIAAAFLAGMTTQRSLAANQPRVNVKPLMTQKLDSIEGRELLVLELNLDPGAGSPAHVHPGYVAGYVIEGEFEVGLNDDASQVIKPGEVFFEPEGAVHTTGRNPSETESAKVIVFMLKEIGKAPTALHTH